MSDKKHPDANNDEAPTAINDEDLEQATGGFSFSSTSYSISKFSKTTQAFPTIYGGDGLVDDDGQLGLVDDDGQLG